MRDLVFFIFLYMVLVLSACRQGMSTKEFSGNSHLQSIYDDQYLLRLSKFPGSEKIYYFESCLTTRPWLVKQDGCVGALKNEEGQDVTFTLAMMDTMSLSDREKKQLARMHSHLKDYQARLSRSNQGKVVAAGLIFGGGMAGGVVMAPQMITLAQQTREALEVPWNSLKIRSQETLIAEEEAKLDQIYKNQSEQSRLWYERFGDVSTEKAERVVQGLEDQLTAKGFSTIEVPKSLLSLDDHKILVRRKHIVSRKFFSFLESEIGYALKVRGETVVQALEWPVVFSEGPQKVNWKDLVERFVARGNSYADVIHPHFLNSFYEFNRINSLFHMSLSRARNLDELTRALQSDAVGVFDKMYDLVRSRGVPDVPAYYVRKLQGLRLVLEEGNPHRLSISARAAVSQSNEKIALAREVIGEAKGKVVLGKKSLGVMPKGLKSLSKKFATIVVATTTVVVGTLKIMGRGAQEAQEGVEDIESRHELLQVMLDSSSDFMSMDPMRAQSVDSVRKILASFSAWQRNFWVDVTDMGVRVEQYCLPTLTSTKGEVIPECHWASPYQDF